jgi:hypothetical protein
MHSNGAKMEMEMKIDATYLAEKPSLQKPMHNDK